MTSFIRELLKNPRILVLFFVWTLPCIVYVVLGIIALAQTGWLLMLAWILPINWLAAWLISTYWKPTGSQRSKQITAPTLPEFWGDRDQAAMRLVEDFRGKIESVEESAFTDPQRFLSDIQGLSRQLAAHYHVKNGEEALHPVTLVEVLAVIHLAVEDLEKWTQENFPASEIATIGQWSRIPGLTRHVGNLSNLAYFASVVFQPIKLLAYPIYRKSGVITTELRAEIATAIYQKCLQMAGFYLIEMYSGRLKSGSTIYKERFGHLVDAVRHAKGDRGQLDRIKPQSLSVAIVGQVNAGKSSLINYLLRDKRAVTNILPETKRVSRHQFGLPDSSVEISLLDTPGYSDIGMTEESMRELLKAICEADIVLHVMSVSSPAKQSDVDMIERLGSHYRQHPELKPPRVIGVLTHVDLLRPIQESQPSYNWRSPTTGKEKSIRAAVDYHRELFGNAIVEYAPLCLLESKLSDESSWEELLELIATELSQGQAVALVRAYYDQFEKGRLERLVDQVANLVKKTIRR